MISPVSLLSSEGSSFQIQMIKNMHSSEHMDSLQRNATTRSLLSFAVEANKQLTLRVVNPSINPSDEHEATDKQITFPTGQSEK